MGNGERGLFFGVNEEKAAGLGFRPSSFWFLVCTLLFSKPEVAKVVCNISWGGKCQRRLAADIYDDDPIMPINHL